MKRITISLPDDLADALVREARRHAVPASAVARDALTRHLELGDGAGRRELPFAVVGRSGHHTTARELEELLSADWDRDAGRR